VKINAVRQSAANQRAHDSTNMSHCDGTSQLATNGFMPVQIIANVKYRHMFVLVRCIDIFQKVLPVF
jgi:hypothetical protein